MVLCGAGMDARAYRLPELAGRRVFELDVKPVLEYKAGVLASVRFIVAFWVERGPAKQDRSGRSPWWRA